MAKDTMLKQIRDLRSETEAYLFMEDLRWHGHPICAHCGSKRVFYLNAQGSGRKTRTGTVSERRVWKCGDCRKQFSAMTNTIFHGSKVELRTWLMVVAEMCASKNGVAAREIERKYGVSAKTAWFMAHRVREAMKERSPESLVGTIVADETYIGGDPKRMNAKTRERWEGRNKAPVQVAPGSIRPNQKTAKIPVVSLINAETGEVRSAVMPNVNGTNLRKFMGKNVNIAGSVLWTDEGSVYRQLGREFLSHESVNHSEGEYVRGPVTINAAENFFSQLKRSIDGTHHHVSSTHLHRYVGEFDFRHSTRKVNDYERTMVFMDQVGDRRLSYKRTRGSV
jgi:transposase-like protein